MLVRCGGANATAPPVGAKLADRLGPLGPHHGGQVRCDGLGATGPCAINSCWCPLRFLQEPGFRGAVRSPRVPQHRFHFLPPLTPAPLSHLLMPPVSPNLLIISLSRFIPGGDFKPSDMIAEFHRVLRRLLTPPLLATLSAGASHPSLPPPARVDVHPPCGSSINGPPRDSGNHVARRTRRGRQERRAAPKKLTPTPVERSAGGAVEPFLLSSFFTFFSFQHADYIYKNSICPP